MDTSLLNSEIGFIPEWPIPGNVQAFVTTRTGGVSKPPYGSNNLAAHVEDCESDVEQNRANLQSHLDLPYQPYWLTQVHGTQLVEACAVLGDQKIPEADGSYTHKTGIACAVLTADCLPILLCDKQGQQVAAVHAGWRGLAAGIIAQAVKQFSVTSENLSAYLGPAISQSCFEVGAEVCEAIESNIQLQRKQFSIPSSRENHFMVDLYQAARLHLNSLGVNEVYGGNFCTYQDANQFYSYRRDGVTGRMASLIWKTE